ncbi:MAG: HAD-IIB family hydrolase [Candidatus Heimdallarchaeota archaeon]
MYSKEKKEDFLLVTDVDNTVLGDFDGLVQFSRELSCIRDDLVLAYNSGRSTQSIKRSLVANPCMPAPDYLIGEVGTQIENFITSEIDNEYIEILKKRWLRDKVEMVLADLPFERQPEEFQSDLKLSYFAAPELDPISLSRRTLNKNGLQATIIYSSQRDLDFLPPRSGKGWAVVRLQEQLGFDKEHVIVAGDSGNDVSMFEHGFKGIVVGNAHPELKELAISSNIYVASESVSKSMESSNIYVATEEYAMGLLEGFRAIGVF